MTGVERQLLNKSQVIRRETGEEQLSLLALIRKRFEPYFGMTQQELMSAFGISNSKDACARITKRILGVNEDDEVSELEKANAKPKTLRLKASGRPKEALSFPAFDYFELEKTDFKHSDFSVQLDQLYLFVIYREQDDGKYALAHICFWRMPERDLAEAKRCYDQMRQNVHEGRAEDSVKSSENRCCHVRPHGRDSHDTKPQPHGTPVVKKCFWLNQSYLQGEIARALENQAN